MVLMPSQMLRNTRSGATTLVLLTSLVAACSGSGPQKGEEPSPAGAAPSSPAAEAPVAAAATTDTYVTDSASTASAAEPAAAATGPVLVPTAPRNYTVRPGDTLWDIASAFLRDPWLWPEIWHVNPQVENPHLIYPGDVLALAYGADGSPQVTLERGGATRLSPRVRSEPLEGAITAIPYEIVASFMSKPTVLEKDEIKDIPYVVSTRDQHLVAAAGNTIYALGELAGDVQSRFNIVHVGDPMRDPDDNDLVGYQGIFTGVARLIATGQPATLEMTESARETLDGDLLFPGTVDVPLDFIPHAPATDIDGRIMSIVNGIAVVGQYQVVVINRGSSHGLEPGHVLAIYHAGSEVRDPHARGVSSSATGIGRSVQLPDWQAGTFMVFKTYDRISYGLIMEAKAPIRVLDRVGKP